MPKHILNYFLGCTSLIASLIAEPKPLIAAGNCPDGFFPIGGGYCRNIVCRQFNVYLYTPDDKDAIATLKKWGASCGDPDFMVTKWGNQVIPMR